MNYYLQVAIGDYTKTCIALTVSGIEIDHVVFSEIDKGTAEDLLALAVLDITRPDPTLDEVRMVTQVKLTVTSTIDLLSEINCEDIVINDDLTVNTATLTALGITVI